MVTQKDILQVDLTIETQEKERLGNAKLFGKAF